MNLTSSTLKNRAKIKLQGLYGQSLLVSLIYSLCLSAVSSIGTASTFLTNGLPMLKDLLSSIENGSGFSGEDMFRFQVSFSPLSSIGGVATLLVAGPLAVGVAHYFLRVTDRNNPQIADLFAEFKNFGNTVVLSLLIGFFTFLWSLLFIVPGIIAALRYSMAPYIMAEHPEIKPLDALKMSKEMMDGHKGQYFMLHLSFIGWYLLGILTCFIGLLFLTPYVETAAAEFFNEVSGKNVQKMQAGVDPNGEAAYPGYAQPQDGFNGYAQPQNNSYTGYAQPQNNSYTGYAQPQNNGGYQGYTGGAPAAPQQPFGGYTQTNPPTPADDAAPRQPGPDAQ